MLRTHILLAVFFLAIASSVTQATAQLITFELTPTATIPVDDTFLTTPYNLTGGGTVKFFFDRNGNNVFDSGIDQEPVFEAAGPDGTDGFSNGGLGVNDTADPLYVGQLGDFFLRPFIAGAVPDPFIIDYNTTQTITQLSGEIWDIDGLPTDTELWQVDVLDGANLVVASTLSPLGFSPLYDGEPWVFAFTGLPAGVDKVRLTFLGTKQGGVGLAFNNFSPTVAVPEPSGFMLLAAGALSLIAMQLRRRRRGKFVA